MNPVLVFLLFAVFFNVCVGLPEEKRSAAPERINDDYPDYQVGVKYDEYPMIVPKKRTALLVNRLMVALKEAIDEEEDREKMARNTNRVDYFSKFDMDSNPDIRTMDLQRRGPSGQQKGRYWRCYFNAVTCF